MKKILLTDRKIVIVLFSGALLLRLWGIWNVSSTDEYNEVLEALRVCSGHLNYERWFKRVYLYILAIEYGLYYIVGWILGIYSNPMHFAEQIVRDMTPLFIMGRVTSALAGAGSVALIYKIGSRHFNRFSGLFASVLICLTVFHINLSQQAKVDALLGFLVVSCLFLYFQMMNSEQYQKRELIWCGISMALAIQTKVNAVSLFIPFIMVLYFGYKDSKINIAKLVKYFLPASILGFVLGNPPVLFAPHKYLENIFGLTEIYTTTKNLVPSKYIGFITYPIMFYNALGPIICLLVLFSLTVAVVLPNRFRIVLLSYIFTFYMLMGATGNLVYNYYLIPVIPFIYLLVGDVLHNFLVKLKLSNLKKKGLTYLFITICLIFPLYNVFHHQLALTGENTRYVAKAWIEQNIPNNSKIFMDSGKSINSFAPPIANNRDSLIRIIENAKNNINQGTIVHGMVDRNALIYYELLLKTVPEKSYDITSSMFGLASKPVEYYVNNNYDYFIIADLMKRDRTSEFMSGKHPDVAAFYNSIDTHKNLSLIKTIKPTITNKGNTFYIYKVVYKEGNLGKT